MKLKKILLSAVAGLPAVEIIQYLQEIGFYVIGMDSGKYNAGRTKVNEWHLVPRVSDPKYFVEVKKIDFDFFIPFLDEELLYWGDPHNGMFLGSKIFLSDYKTIKLCNDKSELYAFCANNNIFFPQYRTKVPAFVKPSIGRGSKEARFVIEDNLLKYYLDYTDYLVCDYIKGNEYTIDCLCGENGELIFCVPRRRIKATNVTLHGIVEMDKELIDFAHMVTEKIKFRGIINIQVIKNEEGIFLIEINPRLAGTCMLSIRAGFDMITSCYEYFVEGKKVFSFKIIDGMEMLRYYNAVYNF